MADKRSKKFGINRPLCQTYSMYLQKKLSNPLLNYKIFSQYFRELPAGSSTKDLMGEQFNPMVYQVEKLKKEIEAQKIKNMERQIQEYMEKEYQEKMNAVRCNRNVTDKTYHSVFLGIPSLGYGFEHLVGKTPQLGSMINFLNQTGFMRAVPFDMSQLGDIESGSATSVNPSLHGFGHESQPSLHSATSSSASLTSSQKSVYGIENQSHWPLGSKHPISDEK